MPLGVPLKPLEWWILGFKFHCSPDAQLCRSFLSPLKVGCLLAPEDKGGWEVIWGYSVVYVTSLPELI